MIPLLFSSFSHLLPSPLFSSSRYPVLVQFLDEEEMLRALRQIPSMCAWQRLLMVRFNRRLTVEQGRKMTVGDVIEEAATSPQERARYMSAFEGFRDAWNLSWKYCQKFGCTKIPKMWSEIKQGLDMPVSFSLPAEENEGMCAVALARFLGQKHNDFVERVDEIYLLRGKESQRSSTRKKEVSSKYMTAANTLSYELTGRHGFLQFVEKQCTHVAYTSGGRGAIECPITLEPIRVPVMDPEGHIYEREAIEDWIKDHGTSPISRVPMTMEDIVVVKGDTGAGGKKGATGRYDFKKAEQYLLDMFFTGKPVLELQTPLFQYTDAKQTMLSRQGLKQKVQQEPMSRDLVDTIKKELNSPAAAQCCLELLQTTVAFLQATGGAVVKRLDVSEELLGDYVKTVLLLEDADFGSKAVAQRVQLKHLDALYDLLEGNIE